MPSARDERTGDSNRAGDFVCRDASAGKHNGDFARHQRDGGRDIELVRTEIDLDRAFRANGQAVADIPYVDAAVYRCGARIQKRDFQVAVFRHRVAERNAHNAVGALAVQNDRGDGTIVDLNFEIAPRLMRAQIVERQYQIADRDVAALRQRHEEFAMSPQIGKAQPVGEADIGQRDFGERIA